MGVPEKRPSVFDAIIVGSGPSGMFAAKKSLELGKHTVMLDIGNTLSPEISSLATLAKDLYIQHQNIHQLDSLIEETLLLRKPTNTKKRFDFDASSAFPPNKISFNENVSNSLGGFSEVWGAAICQMSSHDFALWGFLNREEIEGFYSEVSRIVPNLDDQNAATLLQRRISHYVHKNIIANKTVLAVYKEGSNACLNCQRCMTGCVADAIFSSRQMLSGLMNQGLIYKNRFKVEFFEEIGNEFVRVHLKNVETKSKSFIEGSRLFLGAGAIETSRILGNSTHTSRPIVIKDSRLVYGLHLSFRPFDKIRFRSLSEVSIWKIIKGKSQSYSQIYTIDRSTLNSFFVRNKSIFNRLSIIILTIFRKFLTISLTYFPENESAEIILRGSETSVKDRGRLWIIRKFLRKIVSISPVLMRMFIFPIPLVFKISPPGAGMHFGSSFPHSSLRGISFSDVYGRPYDLRRVHLVDASVLPAVIVGSPTYSIMANSLRIVHRSFNDLD